jgi:organic hydroperoxide reductase OsmC/OhrA
MHYVTDITWTGNHGTGTSTYDAYGRGFRIAVAGKPDLDGSADPAFRGDAKRHNPEDLFVASLAACHMLTYLALCARAGVEVLEYVDHAEGTLEVRGGSGSFTRIALRPSVTVARAPDAARARELHEDAHRACFLAASCRVPIQVEPAVRVADAVAR